MRLEIAVAPACLARGAAACMARGILLTLGEIVRVALGSTATEGDIVAQVDQAIAAVAATTAKSGSSCMTTRKCCAPIFAQKYKRDNYNMH